LSTKAQGPPQTQRQTSTSLIEGHLERQDFNAAFSEALSQQDLELFSWLLSYLSPDIAFSDSGNTLAQDKIIAIIQQASFCLTINPQNKLEWLQYLIVEIDEKDSVIRRYGKSVLVELVDALKKNLPSSKMLIHQVERKLKLLQ